MRDHLVLVAFEEAGIPVKCHVDGSHSVKCHQATYDYLTSAHAEVEVPLSCECRSFRYPHSPEAHRRLPKGDLDWRTWEELADRWQEWERSR
jgi:hypothetical protein